MKKRLILMSICFGLVGGLFAQSVTVKTAEKVAKNFYHQHVNQKNDVRYDEIKLNVLEISRKGESNLFTFNVDKNKGFVVVSSDQSVKPVLAYSFNGDFDYENMSPAQVEFMQWYEYQIKTAKTQKLRASDEVNNQWNKWLNYDPTVKSNERSTGVEPFLAVEWNQNWPYNALCPEDAAGNHGHVYVGCVATAMCQVMKYYNYPSTGEGSVTHYSSNNGGYGTHTVNYSERNYDWNAMPLKASGENEELAQINYDAGVAVTMHWGPDGSGTQTYRVVYALKNYFKYDSSVEQISKDNYADEEDYKVKLRTQLDLKRPLVYRGRTTTSGHAWNCDGYMDEEFHMNWGWGGSNNGYYTLDNLITNATSGSDADNFKYDQAAIINIFPRSSYPEYCGSDRTFTYHQGSFDDGSSNKSYKANQDCEYIISPECGNIVTLRFDQFNLGEGDEINVYKGNSKSAPLLETFDANNEPTKNIVSNNGNLLIQFISDGTNESEGWLASYTTKYCSTNNTFTDENGTVNDGSKSCEYKKLTTCINNIEPTGANAIRLRFTEFDLADDSDRLTVYKGSLSNQVEMYNAQNIPTSLVIDDPKAILVFQTNNNDEVGDGWTVEYESLESSVEDNRYITNINVYPNPTSGLLNVNYNLNESSDVEIRVYSILGKTLYQQNIEGQFGANSIQLTNVFDSYDSGLYFIDIKTKSKTITKKINLAK